MQLRSRWRRREGLFRCRSTVAALAVLSCFLLATPLTLAKPGQPPGLKADEPAYYLMALSLARDFDLRYEPADGDRLLEEFPFQQTRNLIVMTSDNWQTVHYGKPLVYPLIGAPFAALFGANGLLLLNMLLFVAMLWLGTAFLARRTAPGPAAIFTCGLLVLSACSRYVFWLHPEVLNMFGVFGALFWGFGNRRRAWWLTVLSGVLLALPVYNKPMFVALALPLAGVFLLRRQWRRAGLWLSGFLAALAVLAGLSLAWTGQLLPYLGPDARTGVEVCEPGGWPPRITEARRIAAGEAPTTGPAAAAVAIPESPTGNTFTWLFRIPRQSPGEVIENIGYFLVGRHTGLLTYHPYAVIAIALFLLRGRGDRGRQLLGVALAAVAGYFLLFIGWNWHGGGGFIGNRYFVSVAPALLFLVPGRIPFWTLPAGGLAAGLLVGAMVLAPFGVSVPEPTLQAHARNTPLRYLPFEFSLRNLPGYSRSNVGGLRTIGRADRMMDQGGTWWVAAHGPNELFIESTHRFETLVLSVSSPVTPNSLRLRLDDGPAVEVTPAGDGEWLHAVLHSLRPHRKRRQNGQRRWVHRLQVETDRGAPTIWTRVRPPSPCGTYAWNRETRETFHLGARLRILGSHGHLNANVFAARVGTVGLTPATLPSGTELELPVGVTNESVVTWRRQGHVGVNLASRWRRREPGDDGSSMGQVIAEGQRTPLLDLAPGAFETALLHVRTPDQPGDYILEVDLVYEHVAWFAERGSVPLRLPIRVEPSARSNERSD